MDEQFRVGITEAGTVILNGYLISGSGFGNTDHNMQGATFGIQTMFYGILYYGL